MPTETSALWPEPFSITAKGLRDRAAEGDDTSLHHLESVAYHLDTAADACQGAIDLAGGYEAVIEGRQVGVAKRDSIVLVRSGDAAIRGAVSAVDTALMAVNHILRLGIPSPSVKLGAVLRELRGTQVGAPVSDAIEQVTRSIMFDSLRAYRHWVTHRGAPRITAAASSPANTDLSLDDWVVTCHPFVPPVFQRRLKAPIQIPALKEPRRVVMADGRVAFQMFEEVSIHAGRVTLGDVDRDAVSYREQNQETLELGRTRMGGEDLAQYSAREFVRSVNGLCWTLRKALAFESEWDSRLAMAAGFAPPSSAT